MGIKYRAFVRSCTAGPIDTKPLAMVLPGTSELSEVDKADLLDVQELFKNLRRKTVTFVPLPTISGAYGAEYAQPQMAKMWETMRLGHGFARKKVTFAFSLSRPTYSLRTW